MPRRNPSQWTLWVAQPFAGDTSVMDDVRSAPSDESLDEALQRIGPMLESVGMRVPHRMDFLQQIADYIRTLPDKEALNTLIAIDPRIAVWCAYCLLRPFYPKDPALKVLREWARGGKAISFETYRMWRPYVGPINATEYTAGVAEAFDVAFGRANTMTRRFMSESQKVADAVLTYPKTAGINRDHWRFVGDVAVVVYESWFRDFRMMFKGWIEMDGEVIWRFTDLSPAPRPTDQPGPALIDRVAAEAINWAIAEYDGQDLSPEIQQRIAYAIDPYREYTETGSNLYVRRKPGGKQYLVRD